MKNARITSFLIAALLTALWYKTSTGLLWAENSNKKSQSEVRTVTIVPSAIYESEIDQATGKEGPYKEGPYGEIMLDARVKGTNYSPAHQAILRFDRNSLPPGACVTSWTLRLYPKCNVKLKPDLNERCEDKFNTRESQDVFVYPVEFPNGSPTPAGNSLAFGKVTSQDPMLELTRQLREEKECWPKEDTFGFNIKSTTQGVEYGYYGSLRRRKRKSARTSFVISSPGS